MYVLQSRQELFLVSMADTKTVMRFFEIKDVIHDF